MATILVVDDSTVTRKKLKSILEEEYTIIMAANSEEAFLTAFSENQPDLILLDILMPGIDGYEVCKRLKKDSRTKNIPVIFITAKCSEQDELKGFDAGAVDYVTKPFSPVVVQARVRTHVELKKFHDFLESKSYQDELTEIANRRRFFEYLDSLWNLALREHSMLSLIMIDIDRFKMYNDYFGHQEGDFCLRAIAQKLSESVRGKADLVARYGGEEFICVLPGTALTEAMMVAEMFRDGIMSLQIPHPYAADGEFVTISQGVASMIPMPDISPKALIKAADDSLYQSKGHGGNLITNVLI